mgnify:CR=1 FL=1|jgi:hypothetical protein
MGLASDFPTYEAYCESRRFHRLQVIPRVLWEMLKEEIEQGE